LLHLFYPSSLLTICRLIGFLRIFVIVLIRQLGISFGKALTIQDSIWWIGRKSLVRSILAVWVSEQLERSALACLGNLFGIWFNRQTNCGLTSFLTNTQQVQILSMPPLTVVALPLGPLLLKPKMFFVVVIFGVRVQDPPLYGSKTGAPMVLLVHRFLSLTFMTFISPWEMSSLIMVNTPRLFTLTSRRLL